MDTPVHGGYENLYFVFVQQIFRESWVLMYDAVEIKLIIIVLS